MRQEVEFRLKRDVALAPQANAGRASPVARRRRSVMFGDPEGQFSMPNPLSVLHPKSGKLGSRISPYIKAQFRPQITVQKWR